MGEKIRVQLSDWQFNAGILGFYNILKYAGNRVEVKDNYIEFTKDVLENFEEKFFSYLIDTYEDITHWARLKRFYEKQIAHYKDGFKTFNESDLDNFNKMIVELKDYLKRSNYSKVYEFISSEIDIQEEEKRLKQIKLLKGQNIEDVKEDLIQQFKIIESIYKYVYSYDGKKYLFAKTLIYNIVNQSWENVSFLNRMPKHNDIYRDYKETFVDKTIEYLNEDKRKFKLSCFVTGLPIKNKSTAYDMGFLVDTGFDTNRKTSHVWNFYNDVYICDLARLIYSCMPCGMFFTTSDDGIFINCNQSVQELIAANNNVKESIMQSVRQGETNRNLYIYKALVQAMQKEVNIRTEYELSDVQVIRKVNGRYRFNILSREIIETIVNSRDLLNGLISAGYMESRNYYYLYPMVIERILNGVNMFNLIHILLINKLTKSEGVTTYYNSYHIKSINQINLNFLKGVSGLMNEQKRTEMINISNRNGWYLGQEYKDNKEKVKGIAYRLLNALKTRNAESFLHNLLNSYMYVGKQVPKGLIEVLEDEDKLGIIGYAFVTGLVSSALSEEEKENMENINEGVN